MISNIFKVNLRSPAKLNLGFVHVSTIFLSIGVWCMEEPLQHDKEEPVQHHKKN